MKISIFLSYPKPHQACQLRFINELDTYLKGRGFAPRTLGVTDYDMDVPLKAIRRLMLESNGLITIAFRRTFINAAVARKDPDLPHAAETALTNCWCTSPYCQIEPAMAYQIGLPTLILREKGVVAEGLLERGVVGIYMPEFSLDISPTDYLHSAEWADLIGKWEGYVRSVVDIRANPPKLF
jgi:hypothetical protein